MVARKYVLSGLILGARPCCWATASRYPENVPAFAMALWDGPRSAVLPQDTVLHFIKTQNGTITIQVVRSKQAWLGVGLAANYQTTTQTGAPFALGLPDRQQVRILHFGHQGAKEDTAGNVLLLNQRHASIQQNSTHTILSIAIEEKSVSMSTTEITTTQGAPPCRRDYGILIASGFDNNFARSEFLVFQPLDYNVIGFLDKNQVTFNLQKMPRRLNETKNETYDDSEGRKGILDKEGRNKALWLAHASLMYFAWGLIVPLAIGVSVIRGLFADDGVWVQLHRALNTFAVLLNLIGFALALYGVNSDDDKSGAWVAGFLDNSHRLVGVFVALIAIIQALTGYIRPQASEEMIEPGVTDMSRRSRREVEIQAGNSISDDVTVPRGHRGSGSDDLVGFSVNDMPTPRSIRQAGSHDHSGVSGDDEIRPQRIHRTGSRDQRDTSRNDATSPPRIRPTVSYDQDDRTSTQRVRRVRSDDQAGGSRGDGTDPQRIRRTGSDGLEGGDDGDWSDHVGHGEGISVARTARTRVSTINLVQNKTTRRKVWELQHRLLGMGLLGASWYNIHRGIVLYEERYGNVFGDDRSAHEIFWGGVIGLIVSFVILATLARVFYS